MAFDSPTPARAAAPASRALAFPRAWSALAAALLVAACAQGPNVVLVDENGAPAHGEPLPAPAGEPPAAPAPGTAVAPPPPAASVRPLPAPVARPAGHVPQDRSRFMVRAQWSQLPGWRTDEVDAAWSAFLDTCRTLMLRTGRPVPTAAPPYADPYAWQQSCTAAHKLGPRQDAAAVRAFFEKWMDPWTVRNPGGDAATSIATGYYEPLVRASRVRGGAYQWPLHAVPADLLTIDLGGLYPELAGKRVRGKLDGRRVVPYDTRAALEQPHRQPTAIVWVDDPVDAFFLQVQGSGRASLEDGPDQGSVIRLAYADHNGHPYQSIGKWLIDQGELTLPQASMQGIKAWARRNPARVREMLNANPAVVFFREEAISAAGEGPRGALAVPLTAQRSIAVDPAVVPLGSPVFLATTQPNSRQPLNHLVMAQDTGAAIKGPARADVFWGYGEQAGEIAGRMKQASRMWVLWPKAEGAPAAAR